MAKRRRKSRPGGKPQPTLELTASEIDPDEGVRIVEPAVEAEVAPANDGKATSPAGLAAQDEPEKAAETPPSAPLTEEEPAEEAPQTSSESDELETTEPAAAAASSPQSPPVTTAKPARGGGIFSHGLAGILGGVLVVLGLGTFGDKIAPVLPAFQAESPQDSALADRLKALEQQFETKLGDSQSAQNIEDLQRRLTTAEQKLAALDGSGKATQKTVDQLQKTIADQLSTRVSAVETELKQLAALDSKQPGSRALRRLERRLNKKLAAVKKELSKQLATSLDANRQAVAKTFVPLKQLPPLNSSIEQLNTELSQLKAGLTELQGLVETLKLRIDTQGQKLAALPNIEQNISNQVAPLAASVNTLQQQVAGLIAREKQAQAEGRNTALAIALGNLKRAVAEDKPYSTTLKAFKRLAPPQLDLTVLEQYQNTGIASLAQLRKSFEAKSQHALAAEQTGSSGGWVDQLMSSARSVVKVKRTGPIAGDSTLAILSRIEEALKHGDLDKVEQEGQGLKGEARKILTPWLQQVAARNAANKTLEAIEQRIMAALGGNSLGRSVN